MNTSDQKISEVLAKFGEPIAGNVWRVQGTAVIYHKALERIAAQARIQFDSPTIVRAERDEAVILVTGRMGERMEWSIGEALIGTNYRVSGKQAAYVYAMAEKRAKDRVILKLIELHGLVYSEEEADEFKHSRMSPAEAEVAETVVEVSGNPSSIEAELKRKIYEGQVHQRGHRPDAPRGHAARPQRPARGHPGRRTRFRQGTVDRTRLAHQKGGLRRRLS